MCRLMGELEPIPESRRIQIYGSGYLDKSNPRINQHKPMRDGVMKNIECHSASETRAISGKPWVNSEAWMISRNFRVVLSLGISRLGIPWLLINRSGNLQKTDLWYDWPNGRNFNIIGLLSYDLEWDNGRKSTSSATTRMSSLEYPSSGSSLPSGMVEVGAVLHDQHWQAPAYCFPLPHPHTHNKTTSRLLRLQHAASHAMFNQTHAPFCIS
ncbi:hypothetical protein VNO78_10477 [Psophocarpus tetragonolobus]|uniref:Uncharacterized protein n=1 Tax=Psophocarpus tetragonolobus TaxID=3891 RepID=A0AAN9XMK1_PSOTE